MTQPTGQPQRQITKPHMFYPTFTRTDTEQLYQLAGEGVPRPAGTPVLLITPRPLVGQPNLVWDPSTQTYGAVDDLYLESYTPGEGPRQMEIHFVNIDKLYAGQSPTAPLLASEAAKDKVLAALNIPRIPGKPHLSSWTLAMCRLNGLPEVLPCSAIADIVLEDPVIAKFVWFLA